MKTLTCSRATTKPNRHLAAAIEGGRKKWYLSYITLHCTRGSLFWPTL